MRPMLRVCVVWAIGLVVLFGFSRGMSALFGAWGNRTTDLWRLLTGGFVSFALFIVLAVAAAEPPRRESLRLSAGRLSGQHVLVIVAAATAFCFGGNAAWQLLRIAYPANWTLAQAALSGARGPSLLAVLLLIGVASAAGQDLFFRGAMQTAFSRRFGPAFAIGVTSLAFAVYQREPMRGIEAAMLGIFAGLVTEWSESVWAGVTAHVTNNTIATALAPVEGTTEPATALAAIALTAAVLAGSLTWLRRDLVARSSRRPAG
jgi:membrane protease YdiL (CAAX protease family)